MEWNERRSIKIYLITVNLVTTFAFLYHFRTETGLYRFAGMFLPFYELWTQGYVVGGFFDLVPLFSEGVPRNTRLPDTVNAAITSNWLRPGLTFYYDIVLGITGLGSFTFIRLPIGVFVGAASVYLASRILLGQYWVLFAVYYITSSLVGGGLARTVYASVLAVPLVYIVFYAFYHQFASRRRWQMSAIFFCGLLPIPFIWHTATMRVFLLIVGVTVFAIIISWVSKTEDYASVILRLDTQTYRIVSLTAGAAIITLLTLRIWGTTYVARLVMVLVASVDFDLFVNAIENLNFPTLGIGAGGDETGREYIYHYRDYPLGDLHFYTNLGIHLIGGGLMAGTGLTVIYEWVRMRRRLTAEQRRVASLCFGLGLAQVLLMILYSGTALGLHYVPTFFVLIGAYGLLTLKGNRQSVRVFVTILIVICLALSIVLIGIMVQTADHGRNSPTEFGDAKAGAMWTESVVDPDQRLITDFAMFHKYLYFETKYSEPDTRLLRLTVDEYAILVGDEPHTEFRGDLAIVDDQTMAAGQPVHSYRNRNQLRPMLDKINANRGLSKVYDDGRISTRWFSESIDE